MPNEYEVGYGKPPKETQFTKGRSGNPKGRPKGTRNLYTMFSAIALKTITVTDNGRPKSMPQIEAVLHRAMNLALSGNLRAIADVLRLFELVEAAAAAESASSIPHEREAAVFQSLLNRMKRMSQETNLQTDKEAMNEGGDL